MDIDWMKREELDVRPSRRHVTECIGRQLLEAL